jgi:hypothetical protein
MAHENAVWSSLESHPSQNGSAPRIGEGFEPILSLNNQVLMTIGGQLVDSTFRWWPTKEEQCNAACSPNAMKKGRLFTGLDCGEGFEPPTFGL